jgi:hypothetical protein
MAENVRVNVRDALPESLAAVLIAVTIMLAKAESKSTTLLSAATSAIASQSLDTAIRSENTMSLSADIQKPSGFPRPMAMP